MKLNERQKRFVDAYVKTGNASESIRQAGYKTTNADVTATKLMKNPNVKAEIKRRLDELHAANVVDARECHELLSRIIRGKELEETALSVGTGNSARVERVKLPPKIKDRIKAAETMLKILSAVEEKDSELVIKIIPATKPTAQNQF